MVLLTEVKMRDEIKCVAPGIYTVSVSCCLINQPIIHVHVPRISIQKNGTILTATMFWNHRSGRMSGDLTWVRYTDGARALNRDIWNRSIFYMLALWNRMIFILILRHIVAWSLFLIFPVVIDYLQVFFVSSRSFFSDFPWCPTFVSENVYQENTLFNMQVSCPQLLLIVLRYHIYNFWGFNESSIQYKEANYLNWSLQ